MGYVKVFSVSCHTRYSLTKIYQACFSALWSNLDNQGPTAIDNIYVSIRVNCQMLGIGETGIHSGLGSIGSYAMYIPVVTASYVEVASTVETHTLWAPDPTCNDCLLL